MIDASEKTYSVFENPTSRKIISELESSGANILKFPPIETETLDIEIETDNLTKDFDWLIFTDVITAEIFINHLEANDFDLYELDSVRICAFGEAIADQLRFSQIHTDVIADFINPETILAALANYVGKDDFSDLKFLVLCEAAQKNDLINLLENANGNVTRLAVYRMSGFDKISRLKTLLAGGAIDEFVFTAPMDFIWLKFYFEGKNLPEIFAEIKVAAADAVTFQTLREHGFKNPVLYRSPKIDKVNS